KRRFVPSTTTAAEARRGAAPGGGRYPGCGEALGAPSGGPGGMPARAPGGGIAGVGTPGPGPRPGTGAAIGGIPPWPGGGGYAPGGRPATAGNDSESYGRRRGGALDSMRDA